MKTIWVYLVCTIGVWRLDLVQTLPKPYMQNQCSNSTRYTETLLHIATNGLPKTPEPKHIIIIGAGISGLTAGKLLKEAGHKVTILEASDRIGGRIYTYRDPEDRYYADLGPHRIFNDDKFVNAFVKRFRLKTNDFISYNPNTWYHINGKKIMTSEVEENPDILGFDTSQQEKGKSAGGLILEALKPIWDNCSRCGEIDLDCLTYFDHYNCQSMYAGGGNNFVINTTRDGWSNLGPHHSEETDCPPTMATSYQEYMVKEGGLSRGAISMIGALGSESRFYLGIADLANYGLHDSGHYEITGGMDMLPRAFLPSLKDDIINNTRVHHVKHGFGFVVAHYTSSGEDVQISGDYLLTTATATSTTLIKFTPELSSDKREAFRNLHYVGSTKIILVFQKPFWEDEDIHGGETITDLLSHYIYYPSHEFDSGLGVLTASYTVEDQSNKFLGLSEEECLAQALDDLAKVHGNHIKKLYVEGVVKRWSLDPYSIGAFAGFTPYQLTNYLKPIVRPTEELFFAGEHTSYPHAWINTSIKSAIEAVRCISTKRCYTSKS